MAGYFDGALDYAGPSGVTMPDAQEPTSGAPTSYRDPEAFDHADEVHLDRVENRHAAFGLGIHRCAGSHLARMELRVALEVWLEAFPDFRLADPDAVRWSGGQVRGPRVLPVAVGA